MLSARAYAVDRHEETSGTVEPLATILPRLLSQRGVVLAEIPGRGNSLGVGSREQSGGLRGNVCLGTREHACCPSWQEVRR